MKAGRELDALVATKVQGLRGFRGHRPNWMFYPSTDIVAAFLVVDKMRQAHHAAFVLGANGHANQFTAWFNDGIWALAKPQNACPELNDPKCLGSATADTVPLAICLAALAAVRAGA